MSCSAADREEAETTTRLLKPAGAEAKKDTEGKWRVYATTDVLAGASEELRGLFNKV
jgi:hypothetical protein